MFYKGTSDENIKAGAMFQEAISLDPDYAAAFALLGETYIRDWLTFWNEPLETTYERGWANAEKSVTLDDTDSQTHAALGVVSIYTGNLDRARGHLDKALTLNPNNTHALIYRARYDIRAGDPDQAFERCTQARINNPFGKYDFMLAPAYYTTRRYSEAVNVLRGIQDLAPMLSCWLAASLAQDGDVENARRVAQTFLATVISKTRRDGITDPRQLVGIHHGTLAFQTTRRPRSRPRRPAKSRHTGLGPSR